MNTRSTAVLDEFLGAQLVLQLRPATHESRVARIRPATDLAFRTVAVHERIGGDAAISSPDFWGRLNEFELSQMTSTVGISIPPGRRVRLPAIEEDVGEVKALLTDRIRKLAPVLHAIVASKAARVLFPIDDAYFDVDRDEDEGTRDLVMVIPTEANAAQTLAFWASLDFELDRWMAALDERDRELVANRLTLRFAWNGSAGGG